MKDLWLGGYKKDGEWIWKGKVEDTPVTLFDWIPTGPNQNGKSGYCIESVGNRIAAISGWNDTNCKNVNGFICERDMK